TRLDLLGRKNETRQPCPLLSIGVGERALRFTGTLTCQVFFRSVSFRMRNRGRVSGLQAALSGSNPKAPGFAGGYLLISAGYEDGNDANSLRSDPMFKMALDLSPSDRELCSQSTISRLENLPDVRAL